MRTGGDLVGELGVSFSNSNSKCLRAFGEILSRLLVGDVVGVTFVLFSLEGFDCSAFLAFCPEF